MRAEQEERFSAFAASRGPALLRLAWFLTANRDDAQDLVQTALAKIYVSWRRVEASENIDAYARRVVLNAATDDHRRRSRRQREHLSDTPQERADRSDVADEVASADRLRRLLAVLPSRQRAVIALRFGEDLSEAETAAALGINVGTVKSHTARALARLRELHSDDETTEESDHVRLR